MLEYLLDNGSFPETVASLKREASLDISDGSKSKGILEKKWTSVVRLQKKVPTCCYRLFSHFDNSLNYI